MARLGFVDIDLTGHSYSCLNRSGKVACYCCFGTMLSGMRCMLEGDGILCLAFGADHAHRCRKETLCSLDVAIICLLMGPRKVKPGIQL
jgi:hypothetical protein